MDMTRNGPNRTPPINPVRILRARQQVYSVSRALIGGLKHATFSIELGAEFATGTHRVIESEFSNDGFMKLRSAALLPRTANVSPLIDLN
jgi:hypothetical protein